METAAGTGPGMLLWVGVGIGSCIGVLLALYNLYVLVQFLRAPGDKASPMSLGAWILSFASLFLGPCGLFTGLIALVLARIEQGRIYNEQSSPSSQTPVNMASVNFAVFVIVSIVMTITTWLGFR